MADGPEPRPRRDDGYQAAGRIESRASRRGRLGILAVALVVVAWAGATVGPRLGGAPPPGSGPPGSLGSGATGLLPSPPPIDDSGYLPGLEVRQAGRAQGRLPLVVGGLAWMELALARIDATVDLSMTQWLFALPFGETACVCLGAEPDGGRELLVRRYLANDNLGYANPYVDWLPPGFDLTLVDAAPSPDGRAAIVASVVPEADGLRLRVERLPLFTGDPNGNALGSIPLDLTGLGDPGRLTLRVMVAPDGSVVRVTLQRLADDLVGITGVERSWTIPMDPAIGFGPFAEEPPVPDDVTPATCRGGALATASDAVALCTSLGTDAQGRAALFVRIDHRGRYHDVDLGASFREGEILGWQVDGTRGQVYVWEAFAHRAFRVDVATRTSHEAVLGDGSGQNLPSIPPSPEASGFPPPDGTAGTLWQPTDSARNVTANLLAGSVDGRRLYAGGLVFPTGPGATGPGVDSSGIWVLDAATLRPLAHWPAIAAYQALGLSPDGGFLIGIGAPSSSELATYGNHGPQLVLHDPDDGSVIEIQRSLVLRLGGTPSLLPPAIPDPAAPPG
ncbi:MAG TPA: hypothetical protein VGI98_07100 [Candidatus Limnocylindrales bacterium]